MPYSGPLIWRSGVSLAGRDGVAVLRQAGVGRGYAGPLTAPNAGDARPAGLPFIEMAAPDLPGFAQPREFAF